MTALATAGLVGVWLLRWIGLSDHTDGKPWFGEEFGFVQDAPCRTFCAGMPQGWRAITRGQMKSLKSRQAVTAMLLAAV